MFQHIGSAFRGHKVKTEMNVAASQFNGSRLVVVVHAEEHRSLGGQHLSGRKLRLRKCFTKARRHAHHFAGGFHLRPQNRIDAGKL